MAYHKTNTTTCSFMYQFYIVKCKHFMNAVMKSLTPVMTMCNVYAFKSVIPMLCVQVNLRYLCYTVLMTIHSCHTHVCCVNTMKQWGIVHVRVAGSLTAIMTLS